MKACCGLSASACQHGAWRRLVGTLRPYGPRRQPIHLRPHPSAHEEPVRREGVLPSLPWRTETTGRKRGEAVALPTSEGASPSVPASGARRA
jgi:hypothetical protein